MSALESELNELIRKKKDIDKALTQLEVQIYNYESNYLEESYSNITQGIESYLSNRADRKKYNIKEEERIFSNSSVTYQRVTKMLIFSH